MAQVEEKNSPIVSRTIRTDKTDYVLDIEHTLFQAENYKQFLTFKTVSDADLAFQKLKEANVRSLFLTYSLFVKSQNELTEEDLRTFVLNIAPTANITYIRINSNLHTGKLVVDILSDYQLIKKSSTDDLKFFHFDPKRVKTNRTNNNFSGSEKRSVRRDSESSFSRGGSGRGGSGRNSSGRGGSSRGGSGRGGSSRSN
jgi:hypothetical protein